MTAFFRCDATCGLGFGHMSRCLALAEAFRQTGIASSFVGLFDQDARDQIELLGFSCVDVAHPVNSDDSEHRFLSDIMAPHSGGFVVIDSYRADEAYLSALKSVGPPIIVVDDFNTLKYFPCDVLLNFTWEARSLAYPKGPVHLLGPDYFPARRRLVELRPQSLQRRRSGRVGNLLIAIGGTDPKGIAPRMASMLRHRHAGVCVRVISAGSSDLADALADFAPGSATLSKLPDLSEQLLWADACITGGGLIKYEAAFMGVPAAAISQNEGQAQETRSLARAGLVFDLGLADERSDEELEQALETFFADHGLRDNQIARIRGLFPSDPSANAARAIVGVVGE